MQAAQEESERQGLGVSKEGQQLFDCFYKTMPCRWQGKTILVLGEVLPIFMSVPRTTREFTAQLPYATELADVQVPIQHLCYAGEDPGAL